MEHRFDLELREARRIIREHNDDPDDFTFTLTEKKRLGGHLVKYTVTVSRGKSAPAIYDWGQGRNWVVLFAHDLGVRRFSEDPGGMSPPD